MLRHLRDAACSTIIIHSHRDFNRPPGFLKISKTGLYSFRKRFYDMLGQNDMFFYKPD